MTQYVPSWENYTIMTLYKVFQVFNKQTNMKNGIIFAK